MKFTVERSILSEAVTVASGAVSSKSSLPALEGVLIEASTNGNVKITGYDLEIAIVSTVMANVEHSGAVILSAVTFGEIIRKLPDDMVTISCDSDNKVDIVSGPSFFSIIGTPSVDFPELPVVDYKNQIILSQNKLLSMIKQSVFAVSTNESKPIYTGCLVEVEQQQMRMIGVDGYRLALRRETLAQAQNEDLSFVIPGKTLLKVSRMLQESDEPAKINVSSKHALFEIENMVLITRLLEGEFLNYRNALPKEKNIDIVSDVKPFVDSIERASLLINERQRSPIKLNFNDDDVKLSCQSPMGRVSDSFVVKSQGGELEIGFNNKYLLDAFRNTRLEKVRIELKDNLSPIVIKPLEDDNFLFLVLPVRLKGE